VSLQIKLQLASVSHLITWNLPSPNRPTSFPQTIEATRRRISIWVLTNKRKTTRKNVKKFQVSVVSELITVPSSTEEIGSLLPQFIFFTSWLEQMKILLTILQNSLQQIIKSISIVLHWFMLSIYCILYWISNIVPTTYSFDKKMYHCVIL